MDTVAIGGDLEVHRLGFGAMRITGRGQIALARLLARSPVMLPIPGTSSVEHLEANLAATQIELSGDELDEIGNVSRG